jgi:N-methylhydantoinase B
VFRHVLAGAGGWGDPLERDPVAVLKDVRNEFLSARKALDDYGVVVDTANWSVNHDATEQRRADIRRQRAWREVPKVQRHDPVAATEKLMLASNE